MSYFAFLTEHGPTMLLGTVTTIKVLICATILYVIISLIFGLMRANTEKEYKSTKEQIKKEQKASMLAYAGPSPG